MKKLIILMAIAVLPLFSSHAQNAAIFNRRELVEVEDDEGTTTFEIFAMDEDGGSTYYLSLGHMGFGNKTVQVQLDPVFNLYMKLGDSLQEAIATMEQYVEQVKGKPGTEVQTTGYLNFAVPTERRSEDITITTRKTVLGRYLEFSAQREGYIRAATIGRSDLKSLTFSLKMYKKVHPKEK